MGNQTAQQRPLTGNSNVPLSGDTQLLQPGMPLRCLTELAGTLAKLLHHGRRQLLLSPVAHRDLIDHIIRMGLAEEFQEVEPALAVGALKASEEVVADLSAVAVPPLVPGPRVVHLDIGRDRQRGRQQLVFLLVE